MTILTIRTDQPEAEIAIYQSHELVDRVRWEAHRELAETLHVKIKSLLEKNSLGWESIQGIVGFHGPGSFTGLRIGLTVANTLAADLHIPIVGEGGESWQKDGVGKLLNGQDDTLIVPNYGSAAKITLPRK